MRLFTDIFRYIYIYTYGASIYIYMYIYKIIANESKDMFQHMTTTYILFSLQQISRNWYLNSFVSLSILQVEPLTRPTLKRQGLARQECPSRLSDGSLRHHLRTEDRCRSHGRVSVVKLAPEILFSNKEFARNHGVLFVIAIVCKKT